MRDVKTLFVLKRLHTALLVKPGNKIFLVQLCVPLCVDNNIGLFIANVEQ